MNGGKALARMLSRRRVLLAATASLVCPTPGRTQGFAGLGIAIDGFASPDPSTQLSFPADHAAHPAFRIEWWYVTAVLSGADGAEFGVQWTLFRTALAPPDAARPNGGTVWSDAQLWMGHAAATSATAHHVAERMGRGGTGQAGVTAAPFEARIDNWTMSALPPSGSDPLNRLHLVARDLRFAYDLQLTAAGPLVLHGARGYSVKSATGQASHYYSQPFYQVAGSLTMDGSTVAVTGQGWLDREWSSQPLEATQTGWDWVSLVFDSGDRLMGFRLRGSEGDFTSGTWIAADGRTTAIPDGALVLTPLRQARVAGREIPVDWRVIWGKGGVDVQLAALNDQAWMATSVPYWEGPVTITGSHPGRGYLEMTGY